MAMNPETYEEFQREIELQKQEQLHSENKGAKVKVDEDGTEYEWDESKKAWFPKLSVELMLQYQSNYGENNDVTQSSTYVDPVTKITFKWNAEKSRWEPMSENNNSKCKYTSPNGVTYVWNLEKGCWESDPDSEKKTGENGVKEETSTQGNGASTSAEQGASGDVRTSDHTYTDPNSGTIYTWNDEKHAWVSSDGQILLPSAESSSYTDPATKKTYSWSKETQQWVETKPQRKKKKKETKRKASEPTWFEATEDKNTNVYVQGLPPDIGLDEFAALMSKCGIVMPNPHTGDPKVKLYKDGRGNLKGDGLCCYLKKESLDLAVQLLDDTEVRGGYRIQVQKANFELKGSYDPKKKPKMMSKKEKMKLQKQQEKMLDWKLARQEGAKKTERVLIFKHMFEPKEFEIDAVLITEIRDDLRSECEKFGQVKKVIVFDRHPGGVCSVSFKDHDEASECMTAMTGRWFGGKKIEVSVWDGVTDYEIEETDKEREVRIKNWEKFLESDNSKESPPADDDSNPTLPSTATDESKKADEHPDNTE